MLTSCLCVAMLLIGSQNNCSLRRLSTPGVMHTRRVYTRNNFTCFHCWGCHMDITLEGNKPSLTQTLVDVTPTKKKVDIDPLVVVITFHFPFISVV